MHPIIHVGNFSLVAYNLFFFLGSVTVLWGSTWLANKKGLSGKKVFVILFITAIFSLLGARFFHVLIDFPFYYANPKLLFNINFQGQAVYGGLIFAFLSLYFLSKKFKLPYWQLLDYTTPFLGIGLSIGRIGCYLAGCCFGKETNLPWGVSFPLLSPVHKHQLSQNIGTFFYSHQVHPTQIYEMIIGVFISLLAIFLLKKKIAPGTIFLVAGTIYTIFRLGIYFLRTPSPTFSASAYFYPIFYIIIILLLLIMLYWRNFKASATEKF